MQNEQSRVPLFTIGFKLNEQGNLVMDTFHTYDSFMNLPMFVQHKLINETMEQLGERPVYTGGGISLN